MRKFPGTPQTLPCGDEDPLFGFHEDSSDDNDSVGVNIGDNTSSVFARNYSYQETQSTSSCSKNSRHQKDFRYSDEDTASITTVEKQKKDNDDSDRNLKNLSFHGNMKKKRRQYRSKLLSRSNLSKIFKQAVQSPSESSASPHRSRRHQNDRKSLNDKDRLYHFLEDEDQFDVPQYFEDDRSSAVSLPIFSSFSRKMKSSSDASSSASASTSVTRISRASKLKWNQLLNKDTLSTFRTSELSPPSELTSSSSVVSSIASCYSAPISLRRFDEGDAKGHLAPCSHHAPLSQDVLFSSRVDEEDEEDTEVEDDDHPAAGSFAFAIGRGEC